ncbi:MAG: phage tail protein [Bacteroidota bacterium]
MKWTWKEPKWEQLYYGVLSFYVDHEEFTSLVQKRDYQWTTQNRLASGTVRLLQLFPTDLFGGPKLQYTGRYDVTVEVNGKFVDRDGFWASPEIQMLILRTMAKAGVPLPLFYGEGLILGLFAVKSIEQGVERQAGQTRIVTEETVSGNRTTQTISESKLQHAPETNFRIVFQRYSLM